VGCDGRVQLPQVALPNSSCLRSFNGLIESISARRPGRNPSAG
jgi:hypothetical protein